MVGRHQRTDRQFLGNPVDVATDEADVIQLPVVHRRQGAGGLAAAIPHADAGDRVELLAIRAHDADRGDDGGDVRPADADNIMDLSAQGLR